MVTRVRHTALLCALSVVAVGSGAGLACVDGAGPTELEQEGFLVGDVNVVASKTPAVDGVISGGEWANATKWKNLMINVPEGGTTEGQILITNDNANLYIALVVERDMPDINANLVITFNNDGSGGLEEGDDYVVGGVDGWFYDGFYSDRFGGGLRGVGDGADPTGTVDGAASGGHSRGRTVIEVVHPLDSSDDAHDISVAPGDALTFLLNVNLFDSQGATRTWLPWQTLKIACTKNGKIFRTRFCSSP